jgi:hypothetical protein
MTTMGWRLRPCQGGCQVLGCYRGGLKLPVPVTSASDPDGHHWVKLEDIEIKPTTMT